MNFNRDWRLEVLLFGIRKFVIIGIQVMRRIEFSEIKGLIAGNDVKPVRKNVNVVLIAIGDIHSYPHEKTREPAPEVISIPVCIFRSG